MPINFWSVAGNISQWFEETAQINLNGLSTEDKSTFSAHGKQESQVSTGSKNYCLFMRKREKDNDK